MYWTIRRDGEVNCVYIYIYMKLNNLSLYYYYTYPNIKTTHTQTHIHIYTHTHTRTTYTNLIVRKRVKQNFRCFIFRIRLKFHSIPCFDFILYRGYVCFAAECLYIDVSTYYIYWLQTVSGTYMSAHWLTLNNQYIGLTT